MDRIVVGDETHLPYDRPPLSKQILSSEWDGRRLVVVGAGFIGAETASVARGLGLAVTIGSHPDIEWLRGSGLLLDNGLVCDEFSDAAPGVYGAGDVPRWYNPLFATHTRAVRPWRAAIVGRQGWGTVHEARSRPRNASAA